LEDVALDGRILLEWFSKQSFGRAWTNMIYLRIETSAGFRYHCNDPSSSTKFRVFLDNQKTC
jgi:hypothetical protein